MKKFLTSILFLFVLIPHVLNAESVTRLKNNDLVVFINDYELLVEKIIGPMYQIRVFKLVEHGGCKSSYEECARIALYIAIKEFGEYPKKSVFVLPKTYDWNFVKWVTLPKLGYYRSKFELELSKKTYKNQVIIENNFVLSVNPWEAKIEEIK